MKAFLTILVFIYSLTDSHGQRFHSAFESNSFELNDPMQIIISSHPNVDRHKFKEITDELASLESKVSSKRKGFKSDDLFLEWMFYYVHRKKLGWYEKYVSFSDIFTSKKYDCLTGTILYSYLLDRTKYSYSIYEMDYHIFLVVHLQNKNVLLESTDPLNGYVNDSTQINSRMQQFISDGNSVINFQGVTTDNQQDQGSRISSVVDFKRLAGLQYFNLAVKAFTLENYEEAHRNIVKAEMLYPSQRISAVKDLMLNTL